MDYSKLIDNNKAYDCESLLESGKPSDVVLVADGKELRAHKVILSALSPVFAAMFAHSTKEAQENRVEIADLDMEVVELMVRYIYSGKVELLDQYAIDLFVAADKYQLDSLKSICEDYLLSQISIKTVSELLIFADMYQESDLFTECLEFIAYNAILVMASKSWQKIVDRADLMAKLLERLQLKYSELMIVDGMTSLDLNKQKDNRTGWSSNAAKLFDAANKYQMDSLKPIFKKQLMSEVITTESVSEILIFADMHQITELATKCVDYITDNGTEVMASVGWKKVVVKANLLAKLIEQLYLKYTQMFKQ